MNHERPRVDWRNDRGVALVATLFMVLLLSVLGASMMFVSRTEALSSLNYKSMSQARYAAESGVHAAANHLLFSYVPPGPSGADLLSLYNTTTSPVEYEGAPVVLSSTPGVTSNYPVDDARDAFIAASQGTLSAGVGTTRFTASAQLLSMRQITDTITGLPVTLQTWELTGRGTLPGAGSAQVEVGAIIERQERPVFEYAAFAQFAGCDALTFGGGAATNSYDSRLYGGTGTPALDNYGGNVGTNGNLEGLGNSTVLNGSLSTPRTGVGNCNNNNITAATLNGGATITGGITQLPQAITWPTPPSPNPLPPTSSDSFQKNSGCAGGLVAPLCTAQAGVGATIDPGTACGCTNPPPVVLGNVSVTGGAVLRLNAGTYIVNSLSFSGNSLIEVDSGPIIIQVAGQGQSTPIDFTGGSLVNTTFDPSLLQMVYGGTGTVKLRGGTAFSALVYAPNASASFAGGSDFYGAVIAHKITDMGGTSIHYDRALDTKGLTAGNHVMTAFTWRSF